MLIMKLEIRYKSTSIFIDFFICSTSSMSTQNNLLPYRGVEENGQYVLLANEEQIGTIDFLVILMK